MIIDLDTRRQLDGIRKGVEAVMISVEAYEALYDHDELPSAALLARRPTTIRSASATSPHMF